MFIIFLGPFASVLMPRGCTCGCRLPHSSLESDTVWAMVLCSLLCCGAYMHMAAVHWKHDVCCARTPDSRAAGVEFGFVRNQGVALPASGL